MIRNAKPSVRELKLIANEIKRNVVEICIQRGGYMGQGIALSEIAAVLYFHEMREAEEGWFHDRFVLSNGHDAIMTYGALAVRGDYTMDELRTINADGTVIDQSPIEGQLGFEMTAGSLGQGPSVSAGIALGERKKGSDKRVYCLFSDGELQEGNMWEGAMFAAHYKLDNLCYIIDNNDMQSTADTASIMGVEPVPDKFEAFGIKAIHIDGQDIEALLAAFEEARNTKGRPSAIIADTRLFRGVDCLHAEFSKKHFVSADAFDWDIAFAEIAAQRAGLEAMTD